MKRIAVVGAGVIGVTTAWYLRRLGLDVTVFERESGAALMTSAGNAGIVAPGYVTPWAAPGMPRKLAGYLFAAESPVIVRPAASVAQWRWVGRWLSQCTATRYRRNRERMQRLALYSRDCLRALRAELGIDDQMRQGYLQLFRTAADLDLNAPARRMLDDAGIRHELLDEAQVRAREPSLRADARLVAGLYLPDDESANCQRFVQALAGIAASHGVRFEWGKPITAIRHRNGKVNGLQLQRARPTDPNAFDCDAVVVAAGIDSVRLLQPFGITVPIYPVKGFSATLSLRPDATAPAQALMDEAYKTAITPLGREIRIAGTAEIGNARLTLRSAALKTLRKVARDWFGDALDTDQARYWVGARPMTPDGPPLLGRTGIDGLFVNIGHGSTGWAMSAGSARAVADLVAGRTPELDLEGLTLARLTER